MRAIAHNGVLLERHSRFVRKAIWWALPHTRRKARTCLDPSQNVARGPGDAIGTDAAAWREPPALHVAIDRRSRQTGLQDDGLDAPQKFLRRLGTAVSAIVQRHHGSPSCIRPCERLSTSEAGTTSAERSSLKGGVERSGPANSRFSVSWAPSITWAATEVPRMVEPSDETSSARTANEAKAAERQARRCA